MYRVLKNLQVMAEDQQEDKFSRWLIRYLKLKTISRCVDSFDFAREATKRLHTEELKSRSSSWPVQWCNPKHKYASIFSPGWQHWFRFVHSSSVGANWLTGAMSVLLIVAEVSFSCIATLSLGWLLFITPELNCHCCFSSVSVERQDRLYDHM